MIDWTQPIETLGGNPCKVVHEYLDGDRCVIVDVGMRNERAQTFTEAGVSKKGVVVRNVCRDTSEPLQR